MREGGYVAGRIWAYTRSRGGWKQYGSTLNVPGLFYTDAIAVSSDGKTALISNGSWGFHARVVETGTILAKVGAPAFFGFMSRPSGR